MRAMPEKMLLMLAFFFKNPLSVKNAFLMPAQLPDAYTGRLQLKFSRKIHSKFQILSTDKISMSILHTSMPLEVTRAGIL